MVIEIKTRGPRTCAIIAGLPSTHTMAIRKSKEKILMFHGSISSAFNKSSEACESGVCNPSDIDIRSRIKSCWADQHGLGMP